MTKKEPQDDNILLNKVEELEQKLLESIEKAEKSEDQKQRALADLENFRRREGENRLKWSELAVSEFLQKVLPTFLELSLGAEHSADDDFKKVTDKFFQNLTKNGLEKIAPQAGETLDPNLHEVLMVAVGEPGKVVQLLEAGWKYQNTVLRAAKVSAAIE